MRQILGAFAEYERVMIVQKLRGAKQRKKAQGLKVDGIYPYWQDPRRPGEVAVLARMRQMQKESVTCYGIAKS
jgi:DNA invertase Pin-like site-specific DNA recombinase